MSDALREQVAGLLRKATDEKMCKGGGARRLFEEALDLAAEVGAPWKQVAAYRLAHLLMREEKPELERASQLFQQAGEDDALGPLPWIYHAAVEHRRGRPARASLQKARERLGRRERRAPEFWAGIQARDHDMLELAVYFTGEPYWLAGQGGQWEVLFPASNAWVLVGPSRATARVRFSRQLALAELAEREKQGSVVFEGTPAGIGRIRAPGGTWVRLTEDRLRMLALVLGGQCHSGQDLERRMDLPSPEAYRQTKSRTGRQVAEVMGLEGSAFIESETGLPMLREPRLYGAVPAALIHGREPREWGAES